VFNVLLQVLDDGRLTDGQGRTVDFKNTIVIMTSNLGSPIIQEYFAKAKGQRLNAEGRLDLEKEVMSELKRHFRPEFLNRVDDVIIFQSLDEEELSRIVAGATAAHAGRGQRGEEAAGQRGLRPAIRRAPAQTRRSGTHTQSAVDAPARRGVQAG
jgi:ATP-dependent Clp protease ATP-binding subunit ClpA